MCIPVLKLENQNENCVMKSESIYLNMKCYIISLHMKGYKLEVSNPQHTKVQVFKVKVKNKITLLLCSRKIH
jgi:hypothetical protein